MRLSDEQINWLRKCHPVRWVVLQRHEDFVADEAKAEEFKRLTGRELPIPLLIMNPLAGMPRKLIRA